MSIETSVSVTAGVPTQPIVCLGTEPGDATWFDSELDGLAAVPWADGGAMTEPADLDAWVSAAAAEIATQATRAHVLATGPAAYGAILLAARHPALVVSLVFGDPVVDTGQEEYDAQLAAVRAPSLVIASAPDPGQSTGQAQSIAGGIENGVFVIIDGAQIPAHRERGSSFAEWVAAFTVIAEGLVALTTDQPHKEEPRA